MPLCTPWRLMGEWKYIATVILFLGTEGGEWSASRPGRSTPLGKCLRYPAKEEARWTPELVLTLWRKVRCSSRKSNPHFSVVQSLAKACVSIRFLANGHNPYCGLIRGQHVWKSPKLCNFYNIQNIYGVAWAGLIWLMIGTDGGRLWVAKWTFGYHKMLRFSWLAEELSAYKEELCYCYVL